MQTCDGEIYKPLLDVSEKVSKEYCKLHGYDYMRYDGVIHGTEKWQSTFNRIYLIPEQIGTYDWVFYMDADALITDKSKSLDEYMLQEYAILSCQGDILINNGITMYNMKHPKIKEILEKWKQDYENSSYQGLSNDDFENQISKRIKFNDDQTLLVNILLNGYKQYVKVYDVDEFNGSGNFIKQFTRSVYGSKTIEDRKNEMLRYI